MKNSKSEFHQYLKSKILILPNLSVNLNQTYQEVNAKIIFLNTFELIS